MKNSPLVLLHTCWGRPTNVWTSNALVFGFITLIYINCIYIYIYIYIYMTSPIGSHSSVTFTDYLRMTSASSSTRAAVRFTNVGAAQRWLALVQAYGECFAKVEIFQLEANVVNLFVKMCVNRNHWRLCVDCLCTGATRTKTSQRFCCERSFTRRQI